MTAALSDFPPAVRFERPRLDLDWATRPGTVDRPAVISAHLPGKGMAAFRVILRNGPLLERGETGMAGVLMSALVCGSRYRDADRFAADLERVGAEIVTGITTEAAFATVTVPIAHLEAAAGLVAEGVREPALADADVRHVLQHRIAEVRDATARSGVRAAALLGSALYRPRSDYHHPAMGNADSLVVLDPEHVREAHQRWAGPANVRLVGAGDHSVADVPRILSEAFQGWRAPGPALPLPVAEPTVDPPGLVLAGEPRASQTVLACGAAVPVESEADVAALEAAVQVLGGWYGSRLHTGLRDDRGYTYGVGAEFAHRRGTGGHLCHVQFVTAVAAEVTVPAVRALLAELRRLADDGVDEAELRSAVQSLVRSQALATQGAFQVVAQQSGSLQLGRDPGDAARRTARLLDLDAARVSEAARLLRPEAMVLVAVGDPDRLSGLDDGAAGPR